MEQHLESFQVGLEEFVTAVGIAGYPDQAKKMLHDNLGMTNADEIVGDFYLQLIH